MQALDRKLLRDFRRLWAQSLAIALVLACGVAIQLVSAGMSTALRDTREAYYAENRFADVFASVRRAPRAILPEIAAIPGVIAAEARVAGNVVLDIEGRVEPATGQVLSLPADGEARLNVPLLRSGRLPDPDATDEVAVNEPFARANGFLPGSRFSANLNGHKRELTITGTVLSPEFIYTIGPGSLLPDNTGFGILWMPERAAAAAFGASGAFTDISLELTPDADPREVIDRLDRLLAPYGGLGAHDRELQQSHAFVDAEITQLDSLALVLPPVFFGISAFLVNMVIGRIVALERPHVGLLKAIGYSDWEVCLHYVALAALVALVGIAIGWAAGSWLAHEMALLYAQFFDFPYLIFSLPWSAFAISGLIALAATTLGAIRSALDAARLSPAVAMTPPAPPVFRRGLFDRILALLRPSQPTMMILRSLLRWPLRSALTMLGMALAVAVLVASGFMRASLDELMHSAFTLTNRQDVVLILAEPLPERALTEIARLPGVLAAEGQGSHPAILRNGPREKRLAVEGRRPGDRLSRIVDAAGQPLAPPPAGILLSERVAGSLGVAPGDAVEVEFLTGRRETHLIPVAGTIPLYFGLGAYMDMDALAAILREGPRIALANVALDPSEEQRFQAALKDVPALAGSMMTGKVRQSFLDTVNENIVVMTTVYIVIAVLITVGVAYNGARILLSERARELASLRILGFGVAEVSYVLVGETMILALLAQPLGWLIGGALAFAMIEGFASDLYSVPLVLRPADFATSSLVVLAAALGAALVVRRRLDRLDLVAVMKTRE